MTQIDVAKIDRDFLAIGRFGPKLPRSARHRTTYKPSIWMVDVGSLPDTSSERHSSPLAVPRPLKAPHNLRLFRKALALRSLAPP
jgi:hypothetical protein